MQLRKYFYPSSITNLWKTIPWHFAIFSLEPQILDSLVKHVSKLLLANLENVLCFSLKFPNPHEQWKTQTHWRRVGLLLLLGLAVIQFHSSQLALSEGVALNLKKDLRRLQEYFVRKYREFYLMEQWNVRNVNTYMDLSSPIWTKIFHLTLRDDSKTPHKHNQQANKFQRSKPIISGSTFTMK